MANTETPGTDETYPFAPEGSYAIPEAVGCDAQPEPSFELPKPVMDRTRLNSSDPGLRPTGSAPPIPFSKFNTEPADPRATLRRRPCGRHRRTQSRVVLYSCKTLSFPAACPTHPGARKDETFPFSTVGLSAIARAVVSDAQPEGARRRSGTQAARRASQ
jgi:hypothetical protein